MGLCMRLSYAYMLSTLLPRLSNSWLGYACIIPMPRVTHGPILAHHATAAPAWNPHQRAGLIDLGELGVAGRAAKLGHLVSFSKMGCVTYPHSSSAFSTGLFFSRMPIWAFSIASRYADSNGPYWSRSSSTRIRLGSASICA